jgi:hypothetical protein
VMGVHPNSAQHRAVPVNGNWAIRHAPYSEGLGLN